MSFATVIPSELISLIMPYLHVADPANIATYATVSKEWQRSVEYHTFSKLKVTNSRMEDFGRFLQGNRQLYVRHNDLHVILDPWVQGPGGNYESAKDQMRNNEVFTQTIRSLFKIMSSWKNDASVDARIDVYSPTDYPPFQPGPNRISYLIRALHRRLDKSYLFLLHPEEKGDRDRLLDSVPVIKSIHMCPGRRIWPASCSTILSALPRLESFNGSLFDNEKRKLVRRIRVRQELAKSLQIWPHSLRTMELNFYNNQPQNHTFMPSNILVEPYTEDTLSVELGKFSQQLKELRLEESITMGAEFFWNSESEITPPHWPHLTLICIKYNIITPGGEWMFERDPSDPVDEIELGEDPSLYMDEEELPMPEDQRCNPFRRKSVPEHMSPFYMALGKAASHMPVLKEIWLSANVEMSYFPYTLEYKVTATSACAKWGSTPEFRRDESVLDIWREVSRKNTGAELDVMIETGPGFTLW